MSINDFEEYTNQSIKDRTLLAWSKQSGYHFLSYNEWTAAASYSRVIGVEK